MKYTSFGRVRQHFEFVKSCVSINRKNKTLEIFDGFHMHQITEHLYELGLKLIQKGKVD